MQARRDQRRAGQGAHLELELRQVAGVDAVVARVVRPRRDLVGDERAVGEHEELDAQDADVVERPRQPLGAGDRLVLLRRSDRGARRHARHGEDAVAVDVVLDRQVDDRAVAAAGDDDADLGRQRQALLEHAGDAAERRERGGQGAAFGDRDLALAVVAEASRLQDRRKERRHRRRRRRRAVAISRCGAQATPLRDEGRLLGGAVLADRDRRGRRRDRPAQRQRLQRSRRNVLELGRDRVAHRGEAIEARRIEVVAHGCGRARPAPAGLSGSGSSTTVR